VHSVVSAEEVLALLSEHKPTALRLHANRGRLDADEWMPDDALTIVLDRVLVDVPIPDRWAVWHWTIDQVLGGIHGLTALAISELALTPTRLTTVATQNPALVTLSCHACAIDPAGAQVIATHLGELTSLWLADNHVGDEGTRPLAAHLAGLTRLNLAENGLGVRGARSIAGSLTRLTQLDLAQNHIGDDGARAIARSVEGLTALDVENGGLKTVGLFGIVDGLGDLEALNIAMNMVSRGDMDALTQRLSRLTELQWGGGWGGGGEVGLIAERLPGLTRLTYRGITDDVDVRTIARHLPQLTRLELADCRLRADLRVIAGRLTGLTHLRVGQSARQASGMGDHGAQTIAEHLPHLTRLDLPHNGLGPAGARAIVERLPKLTHLDLSQNRVGEEGARAIAQGLTRLRRLALSGSDVGDGGARAIAEGLRRLTHLDLGGAAVSDAGGEAIADLSRLSTLGLGGSTLSGRCAFSITQNLPALAHLDLAGTGVDHDGAQRIARGLPNLAGLDLSHTDVARTGVDDVLRVLFSSHPSRLRRLAFDHEGSSDDGLMELFRTDDARAIGAAYRRSVEAREDEKVAFGEAKLVVLGDEAVGKTSLVRALVEGERADPDEQKTQGVNHRIWVTPWAPVAGERTQLNIWDFGGQEILHQTHRYFLSERCILVIVLDRRKQDDKSVEDWLRVAKHRAPRSPVVVVVNKCDDGTHNLDVDFERLQQEHPEIVGVFSTSCSPATMSLGQSMAPLRRCLRQLLTDDERLESVRKQVPKAWVRVREDVRARAAEAQVLSATEFVNLCRDGYDAAERVIDEAEQRGVLRMLHQMGVVVAHGLTPETRSLEGLTLLDPNWFTSAVYALLDYGTAEFDRRTLGERLRRDPDRAPLYPDERLDYIIDLLQQKQFALAFRLPGDADPPRYLLPEALSPTAPAAVGGWDPDSLRFRYRYRKLVRGLIPQFQVFAHPHTQEGGDRWRTGCTLVVDGCPVLIDGDLADNRIEIHVAGPRRRRRDALAVVRSLFAIVHGRVPEVEPQACVPLPDKPAVDVRFDYLCVLEGEEGGDHEFRPDGGDRRYTVAELLDGVHSPRAPAPERVPDQRVWQRETTAIGRRTAIAETAPDRTGRGANLGQVWAIVGGPVGVAGAGAYVLGQSDGWQPEVLLGGLAVGAAIGGLIGLVLGFVRRD
jgi:small GTP-binding protein